MRFSIPKLFHTSPWHALEEAALEASGSGLYSTAADASPVSDEADGEERIYIYVDVAAGLRPYVLAAFLQALERHITEFAYRKGIDIQTVELEALEIGSVKIRLGLRGWLAQGANVSAILALLLSIRGDASTPSPADDVASPPAVCAVMADMMLHEGVNGFFFSGRETPVLGYVPDDLHKMVEREKAVVDSGKAIDASLKHVDGQMRAEVGTPAKLVPVEDARPDKALPLRDGSRYRLIGCFIRDDQGEIGKFVLTDAFPLFGP